MLKAAIKQSESDQIRHRIIPSEAVTAMGEKLKEIRDEIQEILEEEKEEKLVSHCSDIGFELLSQVKPAS